MGRIATLTQRIETPMEPPEIVEVEAGEDVYCDGGAYYGHPIVYLTLGDDGVVDCYYCGRRFQRKDEDQNAA